ncbi:MAG: hypothetical protein EOO61_03415 [Hymenobacter sp.]|nr:MAG: hypothetical protein EOO61_03415 [Hymenobacter sp.]
MACVVVGSIIGIGFTLWYGAITVYTYAGLWGVCIAVAVFALTIFIYSCKLEDIETAKREAQKLKDNIRA